MFSLEALSPLGLHIHVPITYIHTYLLTYLRNNNCPLRQTCDVVSRHFSERFDFLSTVFGRPYSNECMVMIVPSDGQELTNKLPTNSLTKIN